MAKRKNYLSLIVLSLLMIFGLVSCKIHEPEFKSIDNLSVKRISSGDILLTADAEFYNPNGIKMALDSVSIDVIINDEIVGSINQPLKTTMPSKADFTLPLEVRFPSKKLFSNVLDGLFKVLSNEKFEVKYNGFVQTKAVGIPVKVPVRAKSTIEI
ncbi:NDR1/HIN1-like protein [Sediminitomix flava]|uniref:Late embryogenesis abundant protein n=1 Tax=Sediminitomix flava TaxID=379075 RepID=A0A315ZDQ7_SEDFL|nr:LEA type 2 family protein [Sediminitomix flava]PWJ43671.1 late embryogenesis abundant protein [Sediminitomix flava]